jgi:membrane-associated tyrosine- and threonine-specific cdc2-inhibitory kinase
VFDFKRVIALQKYRTPVSITNFRLLMSRLPLEALDATSSSYNCKTIFGRRGVTHHHSPHRLRSQSLDHKFDKMADQAIENAPSSAVTSLHSSFDGTLMKDEQNDSIFRRPVRVSDASTSWDEGADEERNGRKHLLQQGPVEPASMPPGTVRKLPRSSTPSTIENGVATPARISRPPPAKQTPTSASRRRRAPLLQRNSPYRKSPYRKPPTPRPFKLQESVIPPATTFKLQQVGTPSRTTPFYNKFSTVRKADTCFTAATVDNSLDTTTADSQDPASPSTTPFRFSSFPASLPRVNPRSYVEDPSSLDGPGCPTTVRKRMTFSKGTLSDYDYSMLGARQTGRQAILNISRDEEATQNSSMSTISAEAFPHIHSVPSFPPPAMEWKSPDLAAKAEGIDSKFSEDSDMPESRQTRPVSSINTKLFVDDHEEYDDSEDASPVGIHVAKTRLNFSVGASPSDCKLEGQRLAFVSHDEGKQNYSDFAKNQAGVSNSAPLSPSRLDSGSASLRNQTAPCPATPDEVHLHFHVDGAQCSPIPGIPEEDGNNDMDLESSVSPTKIGEQDTSRYSENENEDTGKLSFSQDSSGSSTTSSKMRRLRPMPDMSAFDAGGSVRSGASSRADRSGEDIVPQPQSPKLLCPPTPVRTPAWAHNEPGGNPFVRANSLIVTKVLATCPAQIVDGHSSLENSLMEDEIEQRRTTLSFSTVDEEIDEDSFSPQNDVACPPTYTAEPVRRVSGSSLFAHMSSPVFSNNEAPRSLFSMPKTPFASRFQPPKLISSKSGEVGSVISFDGDFENLGKLGRGAFADVYKVRSRLDGQHYAVKRNRRQFRGKRDRDLAMAEVRTMQTLQNVCAQAGSTVNAKLKGSFSLYVLFFYRAWQEEGYFFCQTELCCRDTCRELHDSLTKDWQAASQKYPSLLNHIQSNEHTTESDMEIDGRLIPESTIWKIVHDVSAGLSHIHACGIVHHDIKPSNIFFVAHPRFGAMCKIGDLGMAGEVGTCEDGQEGDTMYMAPELLASGVKQPCADIFSLGLTLYEMSAGFGWELPSEGPRWHELRSGSHVPELSSTHNRQLVTLIQKMIQSDQSKRPSAEDILKEFLVNEAGSRCDEFLRDYITDTEEFDRLRQERVRLAQREASEVGQTPRNIESGGRDLRTPTQGIPMAPALFSTPPPVAN